VRNLLPRNNASRSLFVSVVTATIPASREAHSLRDRWSATFMPRVCRRGHAGRPTTGRRGSAGGRRNRSWCRNCCTVDEPIKKRPLAFENFHVRGRQIEPRSAVDLGKGLHPSALRRPFDLERVALDGIDVKVAFDGERGHPLAYACRKSNTHIQMMKSAKKWPRQNATNGMYCSRRRHVLVD
jgi:hypothetical protein